MERKRTNIFVALLLLSPVTLALPLMTTMNSAVTTTYTSSQEQTVTYTSAGIQTYYGSTTGTALIQAPIDLSPIVVGFLAPEGKCSQYTYPLTVISGSVLNVEMTSTNPANMYLLPTNAYETSPDGCQLAAPAALLFQANFTEYTLRWTAPASGTFYIILTGPTTVIMLTDAGSSQPVQELANITYATSTQTSFQGYAVTGLSTETYTTTSNQPFYVQPENLPSVGILGLLGLLACLGLVVILLVRMRRQ